MDLDEYDDRVSTLSRLRGEYSKCLGDYRRRSKAQPPAYEPAGTRFVPGSANRCPREALIALHSKSAAAHDRAAHQSTWQHKQTTTDNRRQKMPQGFLNRYLDAPERQLGWCYT